MVEPDEKNSSNAPVDVIAQNFNNSSYWFLMVTVVFFIARIISIPNGILDKTSKDDPGFNNFADKIITIVYIFIVIMVMVFFNTGAIKEKCGADANSSYLVFLTTFFPWLSIFGMLYTFLLVMPSWKSPFSNTFGYIITIYFMQGKTKLLSLIDKSKQSDALTMVIKDNASNIINDYGPENIGKLALLNNVNNTFKKYDPNDKPTRSKYNDVAKLIIMKDYIAEFVWYILTGILVINMTTNFILEQNCI